VRYRYRFGEAPNVVWFAAEIGRDVSGAGGSVDVQDGAVFVTLPDFIEPESIGMLPLFVYDEACDGEGRLVRQVSLGVLHAA